MEVIIMTKEEFLKEIDKLDDEYFQKRWEQLIEEFGQELAVKNYHSMIGFKNHILDNYRNNISYHVEDDCRIITKYQPLLDKMSKEEFIESFGEFKFFLLNNAIKNQQEGVFGYIQKI
jgi:hypothetical protein